MCLFLLSTFAIAQITGIEKTFPQAIYNTPENLNLDNQTNNSLLYSSFQYSINYMSTVNGAIVGDGTTNTNYFGPNNWGGSYGECSSGNWKWIHALCSECSINNKDISVKQNNANGSTWYAGGGASRYMVIDLSMPRTFNELRVFQMFSDGKVTSLKMYSHLNTTTVPFYTDANWTPIFIETSISAGVITGDTVSIPTIINFPYTTSRFLLIEAKNDGSLGNPSYTEIRELKLFDNNSNTPAPIDSMQTPIFTQVTAICEGDALNTLPATSNNGIIGSWSPALNTTATTEYTFLPSSGQCAETATMIIIVTPTSTEPTIECWETNIWNATTCSWITSGTQPIEPTNIECWETNTWDATTCDWITTGTQPIEPTGLECWETNTWDATTCDWITTGTQSIEPTGLECWETNTWDATSCDWIITGTQPTEPTGLECWETNTWDATTCDWITTGTQPTEPTGLECWETNTWDATTCDWITNGTQPTEPTGLECWETNTWDTTTCDWITTGTQPIEPTGLECWETNAWDITTCSWITNGTQPTEPTSLECWETNTWDATTCDWITTGTQPTEPTNIECWETNTWDATTCSWITNGTQPIEPTNNECWETNTWDATTCSWITNGTQPQADILANVIECESYTLQNISNGNYFTAPNGTGSPLFEGDIITTTQTIYIYAEANTTSNCFAESSFTITINPSQDFTLTQANLDIEEDEITVTMFDPSIDYIYSIDGFNYQNNNYFSGFTDGNYTLYVRDINGCIENTVNFTIEIKQFLIQKYFTPNGDNVHETWNIIDNKNEIKLTSIFNRYGKLLIQLKATKRWDGTFKGRLMPTSDYWYVIELKDGTLLKGHFSLVR